MNKSPDKSLGHLKHLFVKISNKSSYFPTSHIISQIYNVNKNKQAKFFEIQILHIFKMSLFGI